MILFIDVDGTLTDGRLHIAATGELFKSFNVKDGYGISVLGRAHNIVPVIITARSSEIVSRRAFELNISEVYQGIKNKSSQMLSILEKYGAECSDSAYIGDDVPDIECMRLCGFTGCPADAVDEVKAVSMYVCRKKGGHGAVREFIEWLIKQQEENI